MGGCTPCPVGMTTDEEGVCVACEGNAIAPVSGMPTCIDCQPGSVASSNKTACEVCEPGKYFDPTATPAMTECTECENGKYALEGASVCTDCPDGSITNNSTGHGQCMVCPTGQWSNTNHTECICATGFYLTEADTCAPCLPGMKCDEPGVTLASVVALPGYYKIGDYVDECPVREACLGNNVCATGYTGLMCHSCVAKYGWSESRLQQRCEYCSASKFLIILAIFFCGLLIALGVAIWVAISYSVKPKLFIIVPLTILYSMAQVNFLVATKPSQYADWFTDYFLLACRYIASIRPTILDLHCLFNKSNPHSVYMQGVFMLIYPPLISLLATVMVSKYVQNHPLQYALHNKNYGTPDFKTLFATSASCVWFILYPDAVWQAFAMWNCLDVHGNKVLYLDYGLSCTSGTYYAGTILLGIPLLVLMPLVHLITFYNRGRQAAILVSQGFKDHMYLWYWMIFARKVAIAGVMAFVKYENHRLLGICIVILVALCFHGYFHPYQHDGHNLLEIIALGVLFTQFSFRIYFFSDLTTSDVRDGMRYTVATFLCAFAVIWIFFVIRYWFKHREEVKRLIQAASEAQNNSQESGQDIGDGEGDGSESDEPIADPEAMGSKKSSGQGSGQREDAGEIVGKEDSISRVSQSKQNISSRRQSIRGGSSGTHEVVDMQEIELTKPKRKIAIHM